MKLKIKINYTILNRVISTLTEINLFNAITLNSLLHILLLRFINGRNLLIYYSRTILNEIR